MYTVGGNKANKAIIGILTGTKPEALKGANIGSLVSGCKLAKHAYFIRHNSLFE